MKHKTPTTRSIDSLRTIGHLRPTTQRNTRRHASEDRFTLLCMIAAVVVSVLVWLCEK